MSYARKVLHDGERILYETQAHWAAYLPAVLLTVLAVTVWGTVFQYAYGHGAGANVLSAINAVGGGVSLVLAVRMFIIVLACQLEEHVVTTSRVISRIGILRRDVSIYPLRSIENVDVRQSVLGRLLGYGTVEIHTAAEQHGIGGRGFINDPAAWQTAIMQAIRGAEPG